MRGTDSETVTLLCGEESRTDKLGGEYQQGNGEFPGWRKRVENHPADTATGCLLRPWLPHPTPASLLPPFITAWRMRALLGNVLLQPPGSWPLASCPHMLHGVLRDKQAHKHKRKAL